MSAEVEYDDLMDLVDSENSEMFLVDQAVEEIEEAEDDLLLDLPELDKQESLMDDIDDNKNKFC